MDHNGTTKEDLILLASIADRKKQCEDRYAPACTAFLDVRQCALAEREFHETKHVLWGGYEDAERRVLVFLPDYLDELPAEEEPLAVLRVTAPKGSRELTHRDYLGSLMSLGIDRSICGDILVRERGADIVILASMGDFLLRNYSKAGRTNFTAELLPVTALQTGTVRTREKRDSVASLRLDALLASAFNMARGKAQEVIRGGIVFVNGLQETRPDHSLAEGDKLVLRGKGKAVLRELGKTTRKDRITVIWEIYG